MILLILRSIIIASLTLIHLCDFVYHDWSLEYMALNFRRTFLCGPAQFSGPSKVVVN